MEQLAGCWLCRHRLTAVGWGAGSSRWDGGHGCSSPNWLAALCRKSRNSHCPSLPFSPQYSSGFQSPAQLPSEPGKSPLLLSCPLGPEICSARRFCFPDQFGAFHIDCCLFSHSACWWIWGVLLLITLPAPLLGEILPNPFLTDVKGIKQYLQEKNIFKLVSLDRLLWLAVLVRG